MFHRLRASILAGVMAFAPAAAEASQNTLFSPTTGTVSGLSLTNNYNNAIDSLNTCNSGASAPTNQLSASASLGNCWLDTSVTPNRVRMYDGVSTWVIIAMIDPSNHYWVPVTGGGTVQSIASAATTDLCSASQNYPTYVSITGSVTITSFGTNCQVGQIKHFVFTGAPLVTQNATSLILPNNASNWQASIGDMMTAVYLGGGNWRVLNIQPAAGLCLNCALLNVADQSVTGGANTPSLSLGTFSSGTQTIDCGARFNQNATNGGAFTLAAPANDGACMVLVTNGASAGAIAFSGFTVGGGTGATLDTTNGHKFTISIWRNNGTSGYFVYAHQ